MIRHYDITVGPFPRGFHLITHQVFDAIPEWPENGLLHVFIQHTSAGICINENSDPDVLHDFRLFFEKLAPEKLAGIKHDVEGPDDMPSHIKSVLTGASVSIPVVHHKPALGTWQGIFLCEFRNHPRPRHLILTMLS